MTKLGTVLAQWEKVEGVKDDGYDNSIDKSRTEVALNDKGRVLRKNLVHHTYESGNYLRSGWHDWGWTV